MFNAFILFSTSGWILTLPKLSHLSQLIYIYLQKIVETAKVFFIASTILVFFLKMSLGPIWIFMHCSSGGMDSLAAFLWVVGCMRVCVASRCIREKKFKGNSRRGCYVEFGHYLINVKADKWTLTWIWGNKSACISARSENCLSKGLVCPYSDSTSTTFPHS